MDQQLKHTKTIIEASEMQYLANGYEINTPGKDMLPTHLGPR